MHENNSLYKELLEIIFTKLNIQSNKKKVIVTGIYGDPVQEQSKGFPPTFKKKQKQKQKGNIQIYFVVSLLISGKKVHRIRNRN